jgi:protein-L-isoaspartate(D-aspartate) O-methyltransferase
VIDTWGGYRTRLVESLRDGGVRDLAVLRAFGETPRHLFVPEALRQRSYDDAALPIGFGQTISQPSTQAAFLEALNLQGTERVLEIGTGSGYQAALLSMLVSHVVTVERLKELADRAKEVLSESRISNVQVVVGDGSLGWRPSAPYDAIIVAAASPSVPEPLIAQLRHGGTLVLPLQRPDGTQELVKLVRGDDAMDRESLGDVQFVPLVGRHGFGEG